MALWSHNEKTVSTFSRPRVPAQHWIIPGQVGFLSRLYFPVHAHFGSHDALLVKGERDREGKEEEEKVGQEAAELGTCGYLNIFL